MKSPLLSVHRCRHRTVEVPMVPGWASSSGSELLCLEPQTKVPFMFSQFIILEIVGTRDQEAMCQGDEQPHNSPQRWCRDTAMLAVQHTHHILRIANKFFCPPQDDWIRTAYWLICPCKERGDFKGVVRFGSGSRSDLGWSPYDTPCYKCPSSAKSQALVTGTHSEGLRQRQWNHHWRPWVHGVKFGRQTSSWNGGQLFYAQQIRQHRHQTWGNI